MKNSKRVLIFISITVFVSCKNETFTTGSTHYFPSVRHIVKNNCTNLCHAPSLGNFSGMPITLETDSNISNLAAQIKSSVADPASPTNRRMPATGSLTIAQIDTIKSWFAKGGKITD